jgi:serine/threonine protein kinase
MAQGTDGTLYGLTTRGQLLTRVEKTWQELPSARLTHIIPKELNLFSDEVGGIWASGGKRHVVHYLNGETERFDLGYGNKLFGIHTNGTPIILGTAGLQLMDKLQTPMPKFATAYKRTTEQAWFGGPSVSWRIQEETITRVPFPGSIDSLALREDGKAYALSEKGLLFETQTMAAPAFTDATREFGLVSITDTPQVNTGDFDGDGHDDLIFATTSGSLRLLVQRVGGFVDQTSRVPISSESKVLGITSCDLDKNGIHDLILKVSEPRKDIRFRYLRAHDGWYEDVSSTEGLGKLDTPNAANVTATCEDVDEDGDLDLLFLQTTDQTDGVLLLENLGFGRFTSSHLPARGLGAGGHHTTTVLHEDIDADSVQDFLLLSSNKPPLLLHGESQNALRDISAQSGLAITGDTHSAWLVDLNNDSLPDLIAVDRKLGVRAWRNLGNNQFSEASGDFGFGQANRGAQSLVSAASLTDLDGNGSMELLTCPEEGRCQLYTGDKNHPEVSDALPRGGLAVLSIVTLDLESDGDLDILLIQEGDDVVWKNHANPLTAWSPVPEQANRGTAMKIIRAFVWARPFPDLLLTGLFLASLFIAIWTLHLRSVRIFLAHPAGFLFVFITSSFALFFVNDSVLLTRTITSVGLSVLVLGGAWLEHNIARKRAARRIAGYRIDALLGHGGMGSVYLAHHDVSGAVVAIKVVHPELLVRAEDRANFRREASVGSQINDSRIVNIIEWGECTFFEGGEAKETAYLVMEMLEGVTLLQYRLQNGGVIPIGIATAIVREVALGLQTLHDAGIVHRDVKPENVMLLPSGEVKLMDLGAARVVGKATQSQRQVLGTLGYLAPEQGRGRAPDPRADIYGAAVVLYELICGHRPFVAEDLVELLQQVLNNLPPPIEGLSEDLQQAIATALSKEPDHRHQTARLFANALEPHAQELRRFDLPKGRTVRSLENFDHTGRRWHEQHSIEDKIGPIHLISCYFQVAFQNRRLPSALEITSVIVRHSWTVIHDKQAREDASVLLRRLANRFHHQDIVARSNAATKPHKIPKLSDPEGPS